ncbi:TetR-like C-terminal domain-containing protein [Nocardia sp. NPDC051463]|uniref:TetR-like C-terminal domain-containing protein n=1 Tax=Nocardia sp. NPDC051463 TaxID=3154845 RepID=UPI003413B0F8
MPRGPVNSVNRLVRSRITPSVSPLAVPARLCRVDLRTLVVRACEVLGDEELRLFAGVVGAARSDPPTCTAVQAIHHALRVPNQDRITAAQQSGYLPQCDPELLEDMLVGAMWYRTLITGGPIDRTFAVLRQSRCGWGVSALRPASWSRPVGAPLSERTRCRFFRPIAGREETDRCAAVSRMCVVKIPLCP